MGHNSDSRVQNKYLLSKSSEPLPKMGNVGDKEAIAENKVTAAVEIKKLHDIPPFLPIILPEREKFCFSVLKLKTNIHLALSGFREIIYTVFFLFSFSSEKPRHLLPLLNIHSCKHLCENLPKLCAANIPGSLLAPIPENLQ